ncbi:MAG: alanine:cation symporter family protein [Cellvibrionaceae bacterium]|nr:alanine:cation symporter family protein [Cellvibrionaceae bacterium]
MSFHRAATLAFAENPRGERAAARDISPSSLASLSHFSFSFSPYNSSFPPIPPDIRIPTSPPDRDIEFPPHSISNFPTPPIPDTPPPALPFPFFLTPHPPPSSLLFHKAFSHAIQAAFASVLPFGEQIVAVSLSLFAFTTILGWSYYGERCAEFLFKHKVVLFYRCLWVVVVPIGALMSLDMVWSIADILNGLMAIPNVIALFALSGLVVRLTRDHFAKRPD